MSKTVHCIDCDKLIWIGSTRCKSCAQVGRLNHKWNEEKVRTIEKKEKKEEKLCCDCSKRISQQSTRCKTCAQKGSLNHFNGKSHTDEAKNKIGITHKGRWAGDKNPRVIQPLLGKDNPNWRGGTCGQIYPAIFKKKMRPLILETYPCCQWCASEEDLVVHHIDHNIKNNEFCNLITLCRSCNSREIFELRILKFYFFRSITENKYQSLYLWDCETEIINLFPGNDPELLQRFKSMEKNPVANQNKEWGVIKQ